MSSPHQTITRFTGAVDLSGHAVPVRLSFSEQAASLAVGDQEIGNWNLDDVDIEDMGTGGFAITAEGDTVVFTPDEPETFRRHLFERETDSGSEADTGDGGVSFSVPDRDQVPSTPETDAASDDRPSTIFALDEPQDDGRPLIEPEDRADEYFAAGILPPSDSALLDRTPIPDQSSPEPPTASEPVPGDGPADLVSEPEPLEEVESPQNAPNPPGPVPEEAAVLEEADVPEEADAPEEQPAPDVTTLPGPGDDVGASPEDPDPVDEEAPAPAPSIAELSIGTAPPREEPLGDDDSTGAGEEDTPSPLSRLLGLARRRRHQPADEAASPGASPDEPWTSRTLSPQEPGQDAEDDTPAGRISLAKRLAGSEPADDAENLRQWMLVAGGGVVGIALIGGIAWGVITLMGGDDPAIATEPVPTTEAPPATSPTTTAPPPPTSVGDTSGVATPTTATTVIDTSAPADAEAFVSAWNQLATTYAYGLAIGDAPDDLPVSESVSSTIAIRYDADRVFTLNAAPQGNGADRDILVAMGMAIAWADPSVAPEGRAEVLGSLGVDVDAPRVADMGGTLSRGGVAYELKVVDGLIRFTIAPES